MKPITLILSLYILSLTFSPGISMAMESGGCAKSCSKETFPSKDSDGCKKEVCAPYSCCLKNLMPMAAPYYHSIPFIEDLQIKSNFSNAHTFISQRLFDIWHPPRLI